MLIPPVTGGIFVIVLDSELYSYRLDTHFLRLALVNSAKFTLTRFFIWDFLKLLLIGCIILFGLGSYFLDFRL
jgi:hypothetical protein